MAEMTRSDYLPQGSATGFALSSKVDKISWEETAQIWNQFFQVQLFQVFLSYINCVQTDLFDTSKGP